MLPKMFGFDGLKVFLRGGYELLVSKIASGSSVATYFARGDDATGDFADPEANIEYSVDKWQNGYISSANPFNIGALQTGASTPTYTVSANASVAGSEAWRVFDGNDATWWQNILVGSPTYSTSYIDIDTVNTRLIASYSIRTYDNDSYKPSSWTLVSSQNGLFAGEETVIDTRTDVVLTKNATTSFNCDVKTSNRYFRLIITDTSSPSDQSVLVVELRLYEGVLATASNTVKAIPAFTGAQNIVPASAQFFNSNGIELSNGDITIQWSSNDSTYSTEYSLDDFKALSKSAFAGLTALFLKIRLIGTVNLAEVWISTEGTLIKTSVSGVGIEVDGVEKTLISASEAKFGTQMYSVPVALTSTANSVNTDCSLSNNFTHTTTEDFTLENPTNLKAGARYSWVFTQGATARVISYGTAFLQTPELTQTVGATDVIEAYCSDGTNLIVNTNPQNSAQLATTAETGSLLAMVPFTSAPSAPVNGYTWLRDEGGQLFLEHRVGGVTKGVELT